MDYDGGTHIASHVFDYTGTSEVGHALRLAGGETGPARSVSVPDPLRFSGQDLPGDTVRMEVFAKYPDLRKTKVNPALVAIAMTMAGSSPAGVGVDGALPAQSRVATEDGNGLAGLLTGKQQRADAPPAYLNYLFFDREMNYQYGGYPESLRSRDKLSR